MAQPGETVVLVLYKPDGVRRQCSPAEIRRVEHGWRSVVSWLRGADPDDLAHTDLVGEVARKAGLRAVRYPTYDIRRWADAASTLVPTEPRRLSAAEPRPFVSVFNTILQDSGLTRTDAKPCRLSVKAIDLLYNAAPRYPHKRDRLISALLEGPTILQRWTGDRTELAQAGKLLARCVLTADTIKNLVHIDLTTRAFADEIFHALESCHPIMPQVRQGIHAPGTSRSSVRAPGEVSPAEGV